MTATETDFKRYLDENKALPDTCTLGNLVWYSAEDAPTYDVDFIEKEFDRLQLNPALLPQRIKALNAYEKATKSIEGSKYTMPGASGEIAEILVREVRRTDEVVVRQFTREVRDRSGRKVTLAYDKVAEMVFYRPVNRDGVVVAGSERLRTTILNEVPDGPEKAILDRLLRQVTDSFVQYRDYYDGAKIRYIMRDYVRYLNGIMLKSGIYFVHSSRTEELKRLQEFVRSLDTASMTTLPLPDITDMREEIVEAFQIEAEKDLTEVCKQIQKLRDTRKLGVSMSAYLKVKEEYNQVMRKASEYSRTLQVSQARTAGAAETTLDMLMALELDIRTSMENGR